MITFVRLRGGRDEPAIGQYLRMNPADQFPQLGQGQPCLLLRVAERGPAG